MIRASTFVAAIVLCTNLLADDERIITREALPEYLKTTGADRAKKANSWAVEDLEHSLKAAIAGEINSTFPEVQRSASSKYTDDRFWFKTPQSKAAHIKKLDERLKAAKAKLEKAEPNYPDLRVDKMRVGSVGCLRCLRGQFEKESVSRTATVLRIIDEDNLICQMGDIEFWLVTATQNIVDGHEFDVGDLCYEVIGTARLGTQTMFKVARLVLDEKR
jgi:hypothetical protein